MPESKYKCIFCGSSKRLTKEHILPKWLRKYLPVNDHRSRHVVSSLDGVGKRGKLERPGTMFSQTLRIVCADCNNGWMSLLQQKAKPILSKLIKNEWPVLSQNDQAIMSTWAAMTTCVSEFSDQHTATIPQDHRSFIFQTKSVPQDWFVWIGRIGKESTPLFPHINHFGAKIRDSLEGNEVDFAFQSTCFTIGHLLIMTMTSTPSGLFDEDSINIERLFEICPISPFKSIVVHMPDKVYDEDGFYEISCVFARMMGLSTFRFDKSGNYIKLT